MLYKHYIFIILFLFSTRNYAQDLELPSHEADFRQIVLNIELPIEQEIVEEPWRQSFNNYMESIRNEYSLQRTNRSLPNVDTSNTFTEYNNCLTTMQEQSSQNFLNTMTNIVSKCDSFFKQFSRKYQERLAREGLDTPEKLAKRIVEEKRRAEANLESSNRPDEVIKVENFLTLEQSIYRVDPQQNLIDDSARLLATQVTSILVNLYQHNEVSEIESSLGEENDALLKVVELGHMITQLSFDETICEYDLSSVDDDGVNQNIITARSILLNSHIVNEQEIEVPLKAFFNLTEEKLNKIKAYRIIQNGKQIWLFRHSINGLEDIWVQAELDNETNTIQYTHFNIKKGRQENLRDARDISLLPQLRVGDTNFNSNSQVILETEVGLRLNTSSNNVPTIGNVQLPNGQISIASASMRTLNQRVNSETRLDVEVERIQLRSTLLANNNNWNLSGTTYYNTFDDQWHAGADARVYNVIGGVSTNLSNEYEYHIGLVVNQNYANVSANQENLNVTVGRQFRNNSGGVSISTDFQQNTNFRVVVFLGR